MDQDPIDIYNRSLKSDTILEAFRLLLQEALRVEADSEGLYVHYGKPPEDNLIDPIPIKEFLDITVTTEHITSPETILLVYEKCRRALTEFKWGELDDFSS
jgi:hypothetical protein|tara:strand:+ start:3787 stop:4089 length:303 start_codon:yes stop_codon:yes gene_type:complete